jgi:hypothetical protein
LDANGHIFVGNQRSGTIGEYTTAGITINAALITGLDEPLGLVVVPEPSGAALAGVGLTLVLVRRMVGRKTELANKPDAANPAMTLWLTIGDRRRRVADLER